jgi:hypothetical protein
MLQGWGTANFYFINSINIQLKKVLSQHRGLKACSSNFRQEMLYLPSTLKVCFNSYTTLSWTAHFHLMNSTFPLTSSHWNLMEIHSNWLKKLLIMNTTFRKVKQHIYSHNTHLMNHYCYGPAYWWPAALYHYEATNYTLLYSQIETQMVTSVRKNGIYKFPLSYSLELLTL